MLFNPKYTLTFLVISAAMATPTVMAQEKTQLTIVPDF